jgi:hypothetical protein
MRNASTAQSRFNDDVCALAIAKMQRLNKRTPTLYSRKTCSAPNIIDAMHRKFPQGFVL